MNRLLNFGGNLDHGYQSLAEVCAVPGLLVFWWGNVFTHESVLFVKGPNTEEFQLVADSVASLHNLIAKIAEGLPLRGETESTPSQKSNNVCRTCIYCYLWRVVIVKKYATAFGLLKEYYMTCGKLNE